MNVKNKTIIGFAVGATALLFFFVYVFYVSQQSVRHTANIQNQTKVVLDELAVFANDSGSPRPMNPGERFLLDDIFEKGNTFETFSEGEERTYTLTNTRRRDLLFSLEFINGDFAFSITDPNGKQWPLSLSTSQYAQRIEIIDAVPGDYKLHIIARPFFRESDNMKFFQGENVTLNVYAFDKQDPDHDNIFVNDDNCPNVNSPNQADSDGDGIGDVCDNCPSVANHDQRDRYPWNPEGWGDGVGDACQNTFGGGENE